MQKVPTKFNCSVCALKLVDVQYDELETCDVILASPESALSPHFHSVLRRKLRKLVCLVTFDEAHVITGWGDGQFRPKYGKVAEILSQIENPATLIASATLSHEMLTKTLDVLCIDSPEIVARSPDRPEIFLSVDNTGFDWLFDVLEERRNATPKTLIYCRSALECGKVLQQFIERFKSKLYSGEDKKPDKRMIAIFSSSITPNGKRAILERFQGETDLRIVIATEAFGMGIDIPDIRNVVLHGLPESFTHLWQQIGRCCRDGQEGCAFIHRRSTRMKIDEGFRRFFICTIQSCIRQEILKNVSLIGVPTSTENKTKCTQCCCRSFCKFCCQDCIPFE